MNCLNCQKEIQNTPGRRAKIFCSDNCRASHWQKERAKRKNPINETPELPKKEDKPVENRPDKSTQTEILDRIKAIREEKIPKERDTVFGKKVWQVEQNKKIKELEDKLK